MEPSGMDFVMYTHRQSAERSEHPARSPCPALRAAAEHGQLPGIFSPNRNPHHYDPFHGNNWRPDSSYHPHNPHSPHNPHNPQNSQNPSSLQGWRQQPIPSQNRPLPAGPYPYPDPFHMASAGGYPHQDHGGPQLIPMMNAPENQGPPTSLPPFNYRPGLPSMSSTPHIHHGRNGSQGSDVSSRPGSLPALNPNPNPIIPTTSAQPSRASLFADAPSPSSHDYIGMSHQLSPLQAGPFPQGTSTSNSRHRAEPNARSRSNTEGGSSQPASYSPTPAQNTTSQGGNDRSPSREAPFDERRGPSVRYRRSTPAVPQSLASSAPSSESSSDEDADAGERSPNYGFLDFIGTGFGMPEDRVRAQQLLRGTMSAKRVASKNAIASLQSIKISDLPLGDRVCVICYNDYGVQNPEGINEAPLRLPKCKHVFGDHCIKKWFEENDTCPYCRDKVPSEPQGARFAQNRGHHMLQFLHQQHAHMQMMRRYQQTQPRESNLPGPSDNHPRFGRSMNHHSALVDLYTPGGRLPSWPSYPLERRSPGNDTDNTRRRPRPRHSGPRTSPSARSFGGSAANGSSQNPYPLGTNTQVPNYNNRHPVTLPGPSNVSGFEMQLPSPSFYSHMGSQPDSYHNPLASVNPPTMSDNYRGPASHARQDQISPLSPTIGGPEVDMTNAEQNTPRRTGSYQRL